jgi:CDP-diacylglycerol---serine O-phosphatidyltransferase
MDKKTAKMVNSKEKKRRRRLRRISVLPSLVTLMNAVCGFASIHFAARGMNDPNALWWQKPELTFFAASAWMIFFAMLADAADGFVARMARSSSSFGGQLDSLADMVSFGIAPAFLMLRIVESTLSNIFSPVSPAFGSLPGRFLWLIAALYLCCAALRLARFNVENTEDSDHKSFSGLPSPAAAGMIAALVLLFSDLCRELQLGPVSHIAEYTAKITIYLLPLVTILVGLLMVSRVPYAHVVNRYLKGRKPFSYLVLVVTILLLLIWKVQLTLAVSSLAFVASGIIGWFWRKYIRKPLTGEQPAAANTMAGTSPADPNFEKQDN